MAPIRRYLRITRYSVLEVRIYLENPSLGPTWLLNPRAPVLPRVIAAIRPLVLPKLREENDRAGMKGKGKKKGAVKDVVVEDDFEVSIFLTDLQTRHALLTKQKTFSDNQTRKQAGNLKSWVTKRGLTHEDAIDVDTNKDADGDGDGVVIRQESDDEGGFGEIGDGSDEGQGRAAKRRRRNESDHQDDTGNGDSTAPDEEDSLFIREEIDVSSDEGFNPAPSTKKRRRRTTQDAEGDEEDEGGPDSEDDTDDKKKLNLNTSYDGFSIYGRILCLVVKRRGGPTGRGRGTGMSGGADGDGSGGGGQGQQMLDTFLSTQAEGGGRMDDD